ncbi:MAG: M67 family metallopeptidase [Salinisphaera sp.]|nr:M67 family metallopeptidase [Salinisphaera sp.]MDN5937624.1 M67 family metallopeptidase [Salinisphaera sp.]
MNQLFIPRPLATRLLFEAQKRPQEEVCGLVGGLGHKLQTLYPTANVAADPDRRFEVDPQQQIDALRCMREAGEQLLAVYHSHPAAPPEPSARDIAELGYPEAALLIISLNIKGVLEMRGWRCRDGDARELRLVVMEDG